MKKFFKDFKTFIARGNILDMAVGVIIGNAFSKIVTSLVNDIIMPLLAGAIGNSSVADLKWVMHPAVTDEAGNVIKAEAAVAYGTFLQMAIQTKNILNFVKKVIREKKLRLWKKRRLLKQEKLELTHQSQRQPIVS